MTRDREPDLDDPTDEEQPSPDCEPDLDDDPTDEDDDA